MADVSFGASEAPVMTDAASFGKVAVLCGGRSAEREVSLMSGEGVLAALRGRGVDAHAFDPAARALDDLVREGFARAFVALHGRYGEDGTVQGALELLGVPYTGSGVMASAVAMDKVFTKRIWATHGLPTPGFSVARCAADVQAAVDRFGLPLAVKPSREGSTIGFTKLVDRAGAAAAFALAARHDEVLCEQFVEGRELTVAILGSGPDAVALPVIEIVAPAGNYDYESKYFRDDTRYYCPADLDEATAAEVRRLALEAYRALGCEGWARADLMLGRVPDAAGRADATHDASAAGGTDAAPRADAQRPYLLEINTAPGMTSHSLVPMAARAAGIGYDELCLRILAHAALKTARAGA